MSQSPSTFRRMLVPYMLLTAASAAGAQGSWFESAQVVPGAGPETKLRLGLSLAISGDTAVVAGPGEDGLGVDHGKAYVYVRNGTTWVEQALLEASDGGNGFFSGQFGASVAVDGDTIVVGSPTKEAYVGVYGSGVAYVYARSGTVWTEQGYLVSSDIDPYEHFGHSVGVSGDTVVVGVPNEDLTFSGQGSAFVFTWTGSLWTEQAKLVGSQPMTDGFFGESVAIEGDTIVVGRPSGPGSGVTGSAFVFVRNAGLWSEEAILQPVGGNVDNRFGASVALDGGRVLAGAPSQGSGAAYVFQHTSTGWTQGSELTPSDPDPDDAFGESVALSGGLALVGAPLDDVASVLDAGSVYAFKGGVASWVEDSKLVPGLIFPSEFGRSVALSGETAWIGAPLYDEGVGLANVKGLAPAPGPGNTHGFDHTTGTLARIDGVAATVTVLANFAPNSVKSLAYVPQTGTLYGVDVATDYLVVLDPAGIQAIGPVGFDRVQGLAYDPGDNVLYGVDRGTDQLITIDITTGAGTAVGSLGIVGFRSLAFDSTRNMLWGTGGLLGNVLCTVDPATGAATGVYSLGQGVMGWNGTDVHGMSYDQSSDRLYLADNNSGWLFSMNPDTFQGALVGTIGLQEDTGIGYIFERTEPVPTSYCTAGTSSSGCTALIGATGSASATAPSGFDVYAVGAEGAKSGLFFFGTNGRQANPWGSGTSYQCVVPPIKRGSLVAGGGTVGACDGLFVQDLNALWCPACAKPVQNPGQGATVQIQLWYRDPANTSNQTTSLSDALEFLVGL